jgi:hypothetical protein
MMRNAVEAKLSKEKLERGHPSPQGFKSWSAGIPARKVKKRCVF